MALPELTLPDGTPQWVCDGHDIELTPMYADVGMRTGHDRRRRVYTTVPRTLGVSLILDRAQMLAIHDWFEGPLMAGQEWFAARVANQGPGLLWWKARFVEPYTAEVLSSQYWRFTAKLLLVGDGSSDGPYTAAMNAAVTVALSGSAVLTVPNDLSAAVTVALQMASNMSAAVTVALTSVRDGAAPSAVDFDKRWIWMRYPYAAGRTSDVTDTSELDQRSWMGI
jgi:hypothetical protein